MPEIVRKTYQPATDRSTFYHQPHLIIKELGFHPGYPVRWWYDDAEQAWIFEGVLLNPPAPVDDGYADRGSYEEDCV